MADKEIFYTVAVTPAELWKRVGDMLREARSSRGWDLINVTRNGGPSYAIVEQIEQGKPKTVTALEKHATALGLSIVNVIALALSEAERPITPEAMEILRTYEQSDVEGRHTLFVVARSVRAASTRAKDQPRDDH